MCRCCHTRSDECFAAAALDPADVAIIAAFVHRLETSYEIMAMFYANLQFITNDVSTGNNRLVMTNTRFQYQRRHLVTWATKREVGQVIK